MDDENEPMILAQSFMDAHDCYISRSLMDSDGYVSKETIRKVNEYPFLLVREKTQSHVFVTLLAFDSNHVLHLIEQDFPDWQIEN